jgi:hypothetical protein
MPNLMTGPLIGHWDVSPSVSQCEYQFGRRLLYVQYPKGQQREPYIARAQETVVEAWDDIGNAIGFAEQFSRGSIPGFWKAHDESHIPGLRFDVYSIHYNVDHPHPIYTVGKNHDFCYEHVIYAEWDFWKEEPITIKLPEPPDRLYLKIRRLGKNRFESAT